MNIETLTEAAKKVSARPGAPSCEHTTAALHVTIEHGIACVEYGIWAHLRYFWRPTLEQAIADALAYDDRAAKIVEATRLRQEADKLEKEAGK